MRAKPRRERIRTRLVYLLVTVCVLLALATTAMRFLVAYAPSFRAETESYLSEVLGRSVSIGGLQAQWQGINPTFTFADVRVDGGRAGSVHRFDQLSVTVSLRELATAQRLKPVEVAVSGLELTVERRASGGVAMTRDGAPAFLAALPARLRLREGSIRVIDQVRGDVYYLSDMNLLYQRLRGGYRLSLAGVLPQFLGGEVQLVAQWQDHQAPLARARVYADIRQARFQALAGMLPAPLATRMPEVRGGGDLELWAEIVDGYARSVSARTAIEDLAIREASGDWLELARRLSGQFHWRRQGDGWALDADQLDYAPRTVSWPTERVSIRADELDPDRQRWRLAADYLDLAWMRSFAARLPYLPKSLQGPITDSLLVGELRDAAGHVTMGPDGVAGYQFQGQVDGLTFQRTAREPRITGLDARITASHLGGRAELTGVDGSFTAPGLFRESLPYQRLDGTVHWAMGADGWRIAAPRLTLRNTDGAVETSAWVFGGAHREPFLDVRARATGFDAASARRYFPVGIMPADLIAWLDNAFEAGRISEAELTLFGPVDEFPYTAGNGVFEVRGAVEGLRFDFLEDWPVAEGMAADLHFKGLQMRIDANAGRVGSIRLGRGSARIANLEDPVLELDLGLRGPGEGYLSFLRRAPITAALRPQLEAVRLTGEHPLSLGLVVPLEHARDARLDGELRLSGAQLSVPGWGEALESVNGQVGFDERGIGIERLTGRWRDHPVLVVAETRAEAKRSTIQVNAYLRMGPDAAPMAGLQPYLSGAADWRLEAYFPGFQGELRGAGVDLRLHSSLQGLGVALPSPLGKSAWSERSVTVSSRVDKDGLAPLAIRYGDLLRARVALRDDGAGIDRAAVRLGEGRPSLGAEPGITVSGALETLTLDRLPERAGTGAGAGGFELPPLRSVDVRIGTLKVKGYQVEELDLSARPRPEHWSVRVRGPNAEGELRLPGAGGALPSVRLDRLHLASAATASAKSDEAGTPRRQDLPAVDLQIDDLAVDARRFGRVEAVLRDAPEGTRLEHFRLDNPVLKVSGSGRWIRGVTGSRTSLQAQFSSTDVGDALTRFGYARSIVGGSASGDAELSWPGRPLDLDVSQLSGSLDFQLADGRLPEVEPGAGRIFGLLSLATLPRRLSLDFEDLFQEGFAVDEIKARFALEGGIARPKVFYIEGPAARVDFDGRIDLAQRRFDQVMTVTPQFSQAVPLIGGLAGGPVAGVVLFVTQQLFQRQVDAIAQYRYRVSGPWADPVLQPMLAPPTTDQALEALNQ